MSSSRAQGTPSAVLNNEETVEVIRTLSSSSASSASTHSSDTCKRVMDVPGLLPPEISPAIAGATSVIEKRAKNVRGQPHKARQEESAAGRTAWQPPPPSPYPTPRKPHSSVDAPILLQHHFSAVELQFQLEQDRAQRSTITPRDVANLVLWSVPAPIPIIESPRIFFIKNKSQVRNTVVIYVNGWSYDEMMCTGVGLPRRHGEEAHRSNALPGQATPSYTTGRDEKISAHTVEVTATAARAKDDCSDSSAHWNKELCRSMLSAVREGRCWARPSQGAGCAGGVQYCPLFIPSTRNELEKDLWWRNDAVRRPGPSSTGSSSALSSLCPKRSRGEGGGEVVDGHRTSPAVEDARGVGSMFQKAMRLHANDPRSGDVATSAEKSVVAASATTEASPAFTSDAFQQHQHLWQDRVVLQEYALHLPEHAGELQQLGFTLVPPEGMTVAVSADTDSPEDEEGETGGWSDSNGEGKRDVWVSFAAASPAATPAVKVVAFDCEMVEVEGGESALARATLVDVLTGNVVLDLLVKPRQRVTDYRTRFSGIDAAMLDPVSTTLADCQSALRRIINTDTFVVGHSLENDFKACKCIPNCYVLDTTWLFPHPAGLPYKNALRFLAQRYLQRRIQQGSHDSTTDALVSAELTQLKLLNGPSFGIRPRVSVLGRIAEAAGSASDGVGSEQEPEKTTSAGLNVQIHLFDDATTLASLLPAPQREDTASAAHREASGEPRTSAPQQPRSALGRIDTVAVRNDEDAMRKAVRALQRRAHQEARDAAAADGVDRDKDATKRPSFSLFWIQLTQAKADVVLPPAEASPPSAAVAMEQEIQAVGGVAPGGDSSSHDTSSAYTAVQFHTVHDTNRRVLRIVEACPDETLVIVLTGRCEGEAGGNHLSRAQGTCFAFVKDSSAPGPRAEELIKLTDHDGVNGLSHPSVVGAEVNDAPMRSENSLATSAASHRVEEKAAMMEHTPPACKQQ